MEVFNSPEGPSALLIHHASEATRTAFADWLRSNSGASILCTLPNGQHVNARIFRVNQCFGRGLILTRLPVTVRPRDILSIEAD